MSSHPHTHMHTRDTGRVDTFLIIAFVVHNVKVGVEVGESGRPERGRGQG